MTLERAMQALWELERSALFSYNNHWDNPKHLQIQQEAATALLALPVETTVKEFDAVQHLNRALIGKEPLVLPWFIERALEWKKVWQDRRVAWMVVREGVREDIVVRGGLPRPTVEPKKERQLSNVLYVPTYPHISLKDNLLGVRFPLEWLGYRRPLLSGMAILVTKLIRPLQFIEAEKVR